MVLAILAQGQMTTAKEPGGDQKGTESQLGDSKLEVFQRPCPLVAELFNSHLSIANM